MPTDLAVLHRRQAAIARLAIMGSSGAHGAAEPTGLELVRHLAQPAVALALGAAVRTADDKGRIKPGFANLADVLGWADGELACHLEFPWAILTHACVGDCP
ncbi:MAG: hypothetical protein ACRDXC_11410 [Acidimicrobiales bacterium]